MRCFWRLLTAYRWSSPARWPVRSRRKSTRSRTRDTLRDSLKWARLALASEHRDPYTVAAPTTLRMHRYGDAMPVQDLSLPQLYKAFEETRAEYIAENGRRSTVSRAL